MRTPGSACYETTHQFEFCLARRRNLDGLYGLLARCRVKETEEGLVWLDAFVGPLFRDLERELQLIIWTQGDGVGAFCKGYSVSFFFFFSVNRRNIDGAAYASERSWSPSDPETVK